MTPQSRWSTAPLVVGGDRRDFLVVELFGDDPHRVGTVPAEALLPHLQGEGDVVGVLPGKVRDRRRLGRALGPVAIVAILNSPLGVADFGKLLAPFDESGIGRFQRKKRRVDAGVVCADVCHFLGRERLGDSRHQCAHPLSRGELLQLVGKIISRLAGKTRKRAARIRNPIEGVTLGAGRSAGRRALRDNDRAPRNLTAVLRLRLHDANDEAERTERGDRPRGKKPVLAHACTRGPGDFRYLFLIASIAQSVAAPMVTE